MTKAIAVQNAIEVVELQVIDGETILLTSVQPDDYEAFARMPKGLVYGGQTFGLTGWNSDTGRVCYKSGKQFAVALN